MTIPQELRRQIEAAFDYRGHVTVRFIDGTQAEGFLFNRQYENPKLPQDNFVDLMLKNADVKKRFPIAMIASIERTGEDCAAGKSYEDYAARRGGAQPETR